MISIVDFSNLCLKAEILKLPHPLIRKGYIEVIDLNKGIKDLNNLRLTPLGQQLVDGTLTKKDLVCIDWIEEYRALFKEAKGRKGDRTTCMDKMCRFKNTYGFTKEEILKGAQMYIESLNGDYRYCVEADNFIFKKAEGTEKSKLLIWVEQVKDTDYLDTDWDKKMT